MFQEETRGRELEILVNGAKDGIFSISESLPRFTKIPNIDIQVHLKDRSTVQDYIELSIEPSDLFAPRPQIVSPGEPVQLVVLDANLLDFEVKPSELTFKLNARLRGKWKEISQKSVILKAEKVDESDQAPVFEKEHYLFVINTAYGNNVEIGEIKASDPDSSQNIQYSLLGEGSSNFKLENGVLIIDCGMAEKCFDQEKEYHFLAMAVDQTGRTSKPASIAIKIESTLADECYIETSRKELTVKNGHLITPFNFIVNNLRRNSIPKFDVKLEGKGSKYFEIEKLTRRLHNLKLTDDIPAGTYVIDIILSQQSGKQRTKITVTSSTEKKIEFEQKKYSINLKDQLIHRGQTIVNIKTKGKHQKGVRYVIRGSNHWINLNTKTGEITVANVPEEDQNVNFKVVAYNKKTGRVLDEATVTLQYEAEKVKTSQVPKSRVLYYNSDGIKFKKEKGLKTRKIVGYTHNQREVVVSNGSYNGDPQGEMYISNDMLKSFLFMQIFFISSDNSAVVYSLLNKNSEVHQKPVFGYPWTSDFDEIKVKITDEGHDFICLPCIHNGNVIDNVTLEADQNVIYNKTNGNCLIFRLAQSMYGWSS
uniref:A2M_N_2 domain-containing protein n=1 Tax=Bursaphelenchus xylophilus TaxID=6326 RepID=A0A1I7SHC2_BURXY